MRIPTPRQRGNKWNVQVRSHGQSVSITEDTPELCLRRAMSILSGLEQAASSRRTLGQALDAYIDKRRATLSPSTIRGYVSYRKYRYQSLMQVPVKDITRDRLQRAANAEARQVSAKTLHSCTSLINSVLMEETGHSFSISLPQLVENTHSYLDPDDIPVFLDAIRGNPIELAALLGLWSLRASEIRAVTKADLDVKRRIIYVHGSVVQDENGNSVQKITNKNKGSRRIIPMCDRIAELYHTLPEDGPLVPYSTKAIYSRVNTICRHAGLPEIGVHGLRHSFASMAYSVNGWDGRLQTMAIGGWSDSKTMDKIYTHIARRDAETYNSAMLDAFNSMTGK